MRNNKLQAKAWKKTDTVIDKENSLDGTKFFRHYNVKITSEKSTN